MSRVAKQPVQLPAGVEFSLVGSEATVKGKNGSLTHKIHDYVTVTQADNILTFAAKDLSGKRQHGGVRRGVGPALAGTTRAVINNMVHGVHVGFEKKLTLIGVGYRAQVKGKILDLTLGFSHPVNFKIPEGVTIESPSATEIIVKSANKQLAGQVAAEIRAYRTPEPYKGKGVRYADEQVIIKDVKK